MSWLTKIVSRFKNPGPQPAPVVLDEPILPNLPKEIKEAAPILPNLSEVRPGTVQTRGLSAFAPVSGKEFLYPQVDHVEIETIYDVESYFSRATRAKLALFLKEGYDLIGRNDERVNYLRVRFQQIARVTGIPTILLWFSCARDLFVHANAYWLKVRDPRYSGGKTRTVDGKTIKPIAGLFPLPVETMVPEIDSHGNIVRWKQDLGSVIRYFAKEDIIHFYTEKKSAYPLGVPGIISSIDDIRALRSMEANVDILMHKHLFPIYLWKVGTEKEPAKRLENGQSEIDVVQSAVDSMPTEGSLVVSERYDVSAIGAENKALRADSYLNYFRERLLAGLDVSSIDVGIGSSASRSTAFTLSRNLVDTVKYHQVIIQRFADYLFSELLEESTFPSNTLFTTDNNVFLQFREIDKEAQIKYENHLVDQFTKNAISHTELRNGLGRDPMTPEEEKELHWEKFGKPEALLRKSVAAPGGSVANNNNPVNQYGSRGAPKLNKDREGNTLQNPLLVAHNDLSLAIQQRFIREGKLDFAKIQMDVTSAYTYATDKLTLHIYRIIRDLYPINYSNQKFLALYSESRRRVELVVSKLKNDILTGLVDFKEETPRVVFESLRHRTSAIYESEIAWASNQAKASVYLQEGLDLKIVNSEDSCPHCRSRLTPLTPNVNIVEALPPFHPYCDCKVEPVVGDQNV